MEENENTNVDLGEDLLGKTVTISGPKPAESGDRLSASEIDDQLQSARILTNEGLTEEAKKVLRKVLLVDPGNAFARQQLEVVHDLELKQIFDDQGGRRSLHTQSTENPSGIDSEAVMRKLDEDLGLGIFEDGRGRPTSAEMTLFQDKQALEDFGRKLERDFPDASVGDRIDWAVAFMEMGFYRLAIRQLEFVLNTVSPSLPSLSPASLLATALILNGQPFEATQALQPLLQDLEIAPEKKIELFYLMGRAYDHLQRPEIAAQWYRKTAEVDPRYRDVQERLRGPRPR